MTQLSTISSFLAAVFCTLWLLRPSMCRSILDVPNRRSLHLVPTPRSGGLAILTGIVVGVALYAPAIDSRLASTGIALGALFAVSMLDDLRGMPVVLRLVVHFAVAATVLLFGPGPGAYSLGGEEPHSIVGWTFGLLFLVWMINLYNFMDGMDGFAAGMAVFGFAAFGCLGWLGASPLFMTLSFIIAGAAGGFLVFNFPPARIFMGDAGSSTLGFLAGAFMLWADSLRLFPFWIGLLIFSPFIVDATATLLRRLLSGERVWEPHKTHYYQRLVQLGWGHRKSTLVEYVVMLLAATGGITATYSSSTFQWLLIGLFAVLYCAAAVIIAAMEKRAHLRVVGIDKQ